jgi:hypothetical protein
VTPSRSLLACAVLVTAWYAIARSQSSPRRTTDLEALPFAPRHYVCYRTSSRPGIDGRLDEPAWRAAPWTEPFVDIEGDTRPRPRFSTRAKMLWDADYLYVAAELEEPDAWATLTGRDSVVYNDNDFEVFVDPDGDTQNYYELEVNPLGTVFDLMLPRPYRDGGPAIVAWDIAGLQSAVNVRGTLNRAGDSDDGWTVEIALPWRVLREAAPGRRPPREGEQWRVNFSRVEWRFDLRQGRYVKRMDPATGKPLACDNWVWSPQGAIDMHMPERWAFVQFSGAEAGTRTDKFVDNPDERVKWALRRLYYRQRRFRSANGRYAQTLDELDGSGIRVEGLEFAPSMQAGRDWYRISTNGFGGTLVNMEQDGRVWVESAVVR